jgi:hypothetical protein
MIEENTVVDFNSAINLLNSATETFKVSIWIPSLKTFLNFKEIEGKQQKMLLSAAMENSIYNTFFSNSFYEIIKNNLIESEEFKKENLDNLTIIDKACIAINLRNRISNSYKMLFDNNNNITKDVDLNEVVEKFKTFELESDTDEISISNENVSINVLIKLPTIKQEVDYDNDIIKIFKKSSDIKTEEDVKNIVTEAFITESSKYINKIFISSNEIDFCGLTLKQKIQITEKLPSKILQKIIETISKWKLKLDDILTVKKDEYTGVIKIDSILFLN